ncbi:phospholipid scramblase-related protein [uncultured Microscilla sp.]|uniref:phospholipid scramblase-related protein n=1 Tax=uncultured Microscilla sp. TaxID=432653 RepID=UPI0026280F88|nr:phospholipid scramblase-related protein [uncultured Microscilla sp.]
MHEVLNQNLFFIEEQVGLLRAANNYDVYNPRTQALILTCQEENLSFLTKITRFTPFKTRSSFHLKINNNAGETLFYIKRKATVNPYVTPIEVYSSEDQLIGKVQPQKTPKNSFEVLNSANEVIYMINKSNDQEFVFLEGSQTLANISKKWAGASKELLTSADNYLLQIMVTVPPDAPVRVLILAAVLCIDMVLYE